MRDSAGRWFTGKNAKIFWIYKTKLVPASFSCIKECSGQYSLLIKMHIVTGNEKLSEIYFKNLFFQNVFAFINFFLNTIISISSSTQIARYVMCVQYVQKQPPEEFFKKDVLKNFVNFAGKHPCWSLFFNKVTGLTGLRACNLIKKRLQHRCVPVKLAKFYEHLFADDCWSNYM